MASPIVKTLIKTLFYAAALGVVVGAYAKQNPEAFAVLPRGRDRLLQGDWYGDRYGIYRHYQFREDGTGRIWTRGREPRDFRWGTDGQRLQMKYRSYNGWSAPEYVFEITSSGQKLSLTGLRDAFSSSLRRDPPARHRLE